MNPEWFAGRLRELREGAGLSRQQLADRAGMKLGGIRDLEQGRRTPGWDTALALCQALAVKPDAFAQPPGELPEAKPGRPRKRTEADETPPAQAKPRGPANEAPAVLTSRGTAMAIISAREAYRQMMEEGRVHPFFPGGFYLDESILWSPELKLAREQEARINCTVEMVDAVIDDLLNQVPEEHPFWNPYVARHIRVLLWRS